MLRLPCILVCGEGLAARIIAEGLRAAGRRVRRSDGLEEVGSRLRSARVLVLADPPPDPRTLVETLGALADSRSRRRPPLRVILTFPGGPPPAVELPESTPVTLELLDLERQAARIWLARRPLHGAIDPPFGQQAHILFAGTAAPYRALSLEAMHLAHYGGSPVVFTFASSDPDRQRQRFLAAYPNAERLCRPRFTTLSGPDLKGQPAVTSVYICESPPEQGLETARRLIRRIADLQRAAPPVHLETGASRAAGEPGSWDGQIFPFSWLREVCRADVLLDGRGDELAQVIHEHYRDSVAAQGRDPETEAGGQPWELLANSYREANRHQADHLWAKLALADCRAVPEEQVESFAFAPLETERLAAIEHARWAADRYLDGWTYAPVRDNSRKHHPQLVPYEDLSEPMKDLDRFAVRLVPTLLARSGRGIVRMLLVGVPAVGAEFQTRGTLDRLVDRVLERLSSRYPDRCLVFASTLEDSACRLVVRRAFERFGAAAFLLCPNPLPEAVAAQPHARARRDLLELAARAERRIGLPGKKGVDDWFARRAELLLLLGPQIGPHLPNKRVRVDPAADSLDWSFEY